jgi:thioredoxin:protein disulfide reductase
MRRNLLLLAALLVAALPAFAQFGQGPEITTEVVSETDAAHPGSTLRVAVLVSVPDGWHVNANKPLEEFLIPTELIVEPAGGIAAEGLVYPEPEPFRFAGSDEDMAVYGGTFPIGLVLTVGADAAPGDHSLAARLEYQACNDTQCWAPSSIELTIPVRIVEAGTALAPQRPDLFASIAFDQATAAETPADTAPDTTETADTGDWRALVDGFSVTGRNSGYIGSANFIAWIDGVEAGTSGSGLNQFAGMNLWLVAFLTLLGGLALNLTPCVLPMIPINIAIIGAGAQASSRGHGFMLGLTYGVAIALVYGLLGILAAVAGTAFGTIQSSPWFNAAIAVVFIILGLAMLDLFLIDFSKYQSKVGVKRGEGGSFIVAFVMGGVAALLAGACVGPVVISVILFSQNLYTDGNPAGLLLPFLLGVGMALPWPFAGAGLSFLPKPGGWMNRVKHGFAVLIFLFAAYYGYEAWRLFADRLVAGDEVAASVSQLDEDGWTTSLTAGLEQARAEGKPVFVDFWATWCKNCLTMNKTTFKDPAVMTRMEGYVKVKHQAQDLGASPHKEIMEHFDVGGYGLPVYVILEPAE